VYYTALHNQAVTNLVCKVPAWPWSYSPLVNRDRLNAFTAAMPWGDQ